MFIAEITDAFGAYNAFGPLACNKFIKESQFERATSVIYIGADAIFFGFTFIMVMMMVVFVVFVVFMMLMVSMMLMLFFLIFIVVIVVMVLLHLLNPSGRSSHIVEIKQVCIDNLIKFYIAIVCVDYFCPRL